MKQLLNAGIITVAIMVSLPTLAVTNDSPRYVTVTPLEDFRAVLHNPDMGWVFYEFGKQIETGYTYPNVDYVAIATHWSDLEPAQGIYNFSALDKLYDYWTAKGKKVMLRLMVEDVGTRTPDYVLKQLAPTERQKRAMIGREGSLYQEIDCRNAFYQARLTAFLSALASHFSPAGPRPIVTADLRGFGMWGEWHSGFVFPGMPPPGDQDYKKIDLTERTKALRQIIDIWSAQMPDITLLLSYSHDPDSPSAYWHDARHYRDYLAYSAFDYATNKGNISWRRDGCGGAIKDNERIFNQTLFNLGKTPLFSEFADGYSSNSAAWAVKDALSLHPNYICLYGYSGHRFYDNHRALFDVGLRTMGYRFVPTSVTYPSTIDPNTNFTLRIVWVNRAVGRALRDYTLALKLKDKAGRDVLRAETGGLGCTNWIEGQKYQVSKTVNPSGVPSGKYQLCLEVIHPMTGQLIALPLKSQNPDGSYAIGPVVVQ